MFDKYLQFLTDESGATVHSGELRETCPSCDGPVGAALLLALLPIPYFWWTRRGGDEAAVLSEAQQ